MKNVTIYIGPRCNFCDAAKRLLNRNNIPFKEINIAIEDGKRDEMLEKSNGRKTICHASHIRHDIAVHKRCEPVKISFADKPTQRDIPRYVITRR